MSQKCLNTIDQPKCLSVVNRAFSSFIFLLLETTYPIEFLDIVFPTKVHLKNETNHAIYIHKPRMDTRQQRVSHLPILLNCNQNLWIKF